MLYDGKGPESSSLEYEPSLARERADAAWRFTTAEGGRLAQTDRTVDKVRRFTPFCCDLRCTLGMFAELESCSDSSSDKAGGAEKKFSKHVMVSIALANNAQAGLLMP